MRRIATWLRDWFTHRDRVKPIDVSRAYGSQVQVAPRPDKHQYNLECVDVNANCHIAIRAETDAVKSLPLNIIGTETVGGVDREFDDNDHPANALIDNPNPEMTMREVVAHLTKSLLGDGNGILTIEMMTGPNGAIEIWPRDPRVMKPLISGGKLTGYRFKNEGKSFVYPPNRVVHIRDVNPIEPFWGKPRFESVRTEIYSDYLINEFNKNFFLNGATLNLMFVPDKDLTTEQADQVADQFQKYTGAERAFKLFINRFAGKLQSPEMKHKDIMFGELLKSNREKIFGAFGLPPFRGGVMEYANYANALAQDKDFWLNTIKPLTVMIEDSLNKQLVWPHFGREISLRFDFSEIPALKGEPKERAEVHKIYIDSGVMTPAQVAEELGIEYEAEPPKIEPTDDEAPIPTEDEEKEAENAILSLFSAQRRKVRSGLREHTRNGRLMGWLIFEDKCADTLLPLTEELDQSEVTVAPALMNAFRLRGGSDESMHDNAVRVALDDINRDTHRMLSAVINDGNRYQWNIGQLAKHTGNLFSRERAKTIAHRLISETVRRAESITEGATA